MAKELYSGFVTENDPKEYSARDYITNFSDLLVMQCGSLLKVNVATWAVSYVKVEDEKVYEYPQTDEYTAIYRNIMHLIDSEDQDRVAALLSPRELRNLKPNSYDAILCRTELSMEEHLQQWYNITVYSRLEEGALIIYIFARELTKTIASLQEVVRDTDYDEYTGLENYNKLRSRLRNSYFDMDSCGVILFEIVGLDEIKKSQGRDAEKAAILRIAGSMAMLMCKDTHIYRYSYKEFLLVDRNARYGEASSRIDQWKIQLDWLKENEGLDCEVYFAKAWSRAPVSVEALIAEAECHIYEMKEKDGKVVKREAEKAIEHLRRRNTTVNNFIKHEYGNMYEVDLDMDTYETLLENEIEISGGIPIKGCFSNITKRFIEEFVAEEYRERMYVFSDIRDLRDRLAVDERLEFEYQIASDEKAWRRLIYQVSKRHPNGKPHKMILANVSIDRSKAERLLEQKVISEAYKMAEEASRAKSDFLSRMSHDIRTPMNAIIGMNAIASSHLDDTARVADCLKKIDSASKHLLSLINDILDLNRIEAGRQEHNPEETTLNQIIESLVTMIRPQAEAKNQNLEVIVKEVEHESLKADLNIIQRILVNIVSNAVKYTPERGRICIECYEQQLPTSEKYSNYVFICDDNGIGMTEEYIEEIFEPFSRSDDARIENIQGTGLGMAITKNLVNMLGGDIKVESTLGVGTRITVVVPLEVVSEELQIFPELQNQEVLLLTNNFEGGENLKNMLMELGMHAKICRSAYEAARVAYQKQASGEEYYAAFIDGDLGGISYITATKLMRQQVGFKLPIVLIAPNSGEDNETEARACGITKSLGKPIFRSTLTEMLKSLYRYRADLDNPFGSKPEVPENKAIFSKDIKFDGRRVLLAEDNQLNAEIAIDIMEMTGVEVVWAADGKSAVDTFNDSEEGYFDMIFMDIQMPIMNGYEATLAIRMLPRLDAARVPIIALTANAFSSDVQQARNAGMNEHLTKPIEFEKLGTIMMKYLK